jgi:hypothetical protein
MMTEEKATKHEMVRFWGATLICSMGFWALVIRQLASMRGW